MDIKLFNVVSWGGNPLGPVVDLALKNMDSNYNFELIESDNLLEEHGIEKAPAMKINGDIVIQGKIPPLNAIKDMIRKYEE